MQRRSSEQTLPINYEEFKLGGDSQKAGTEKQPQFIACLGNQASLIVGNFEVNGITISAIIDTGATASFVSGNTQIVRNFKQPKSPNSITIKTADNGIMTANEVLTISLSPKANPERHITLNLYILPGRTEILGHPMILGIDAIKALDAKIESKKDIMVAHINGITIAKEHRPEKEEKLVTLG